MTGERDFRELFPGYYDAGDSDANWQSALYILDSSALLHLFRCPLEEREQYLDVLRRMRERLWIPFHVALEFHRNRLDVSAEQEKAFDDVEGRVKEALERLRRELPPIARRHALIDTSPLLANLEAVTASFLEQLSNLREGHSRKYEESRLALALNSVFRGRVGAPPQSQADLEKLLADAESRFKKRIPPGYMDAAKSEGRSDDTFSYGGWSYRKSAGDFIVWRQILDFARDAKETRLVIVTDDRKEDWWLSVRGRLIGPRPELAEEAKREAGVSFLRLLTTERFLDRVLSGSPAGGGAPEGAPAAPEQTPSVEADARSLQAEPAGVLDDLGDMEDAADSIGSVQRELLQELESINSRIVSATESLEGATRPSEARRIADKLAREFELLLPRFQEKLDSFETSVARLRPGILRLKKILGMEESLSTEQKATRSALIDLRGVLLKGSESSRGFALVLRESGSATRHLRFSSNRLASLMDRYAGSCEGLARDLDWVETD